MHRALLVSRCVLCVVCRVLILVQFSCVLLVCVLFVDRDPCMLFDVNRCYSCVAICCV